VYVPHFNALDDHAEIARLVEAVGSVELITTGPDGYPLATLLPVVWDDDRLVLHMARANPHWREITEDSTGTPALAVVTGSQAYVSPSWYASKAEHGRVVPTWNYSAVQFTGRVRRHHDPAWVLDAVTWLTRLNESRREESWAVADAPASYVEKQLRAIVGIELTIEKVEAKAKLSQNRGDADISGVVTGLRNEGSGREHEVADQMDALDR
jgi:transcriptional regulator